MAYRCIIESEMTHPREYASDTKSAMRAAEKFGRCEGGERVTIVTKAGRVVSRVCWSPEDGGRYVRAQVCPQEVMG